MSGNPFEVVFTNVQKENEVLEKIRQAMKVLKDNETLIGIPEEANVSHPDPDTGSSSISNAELLYIHTHGSPVNGIPSRDVLESSIKHHQAEIATLLQEATQKAMEGNSEGALKALEKAGMQGQNFARAWFTDSANNWEPNNQATIDRKGSDRPLIDSGELRKAITSVVRKKGKTKR